MTDFSPGRRWERLHADLSAADNEWAVELVGPVIDHRVGLLQRLTGAAVYFSLRDWAFLALWRLALVGLGLTLWLQSPFQLRQPSMWSGWRHSADADTDAIRRHVWGIKRHVAEWREPEAWKDPAYWPQEVQPR